MKQKVPKAVSPNECRKILSALDTDEVSTVIRLIKSKFHPNSLISGESLLTYIKSVKSAQRLIAAGADPNLSKNGWTPIISHSAKGNKAIVKLLIKCGADVNAVYMRKGAFDATPGTTALMQAAGHGHVGTVKLLLSAGGNIKATDVNGHNAIFHALKANNQDIAKLLFLKGCDLTDDILCTAVRRGNVKMTKWLISKGAKANCRFGRFDHDRWWPEGGTLLGYAIKNAGLNEYPVKIAELLIKSGADVNQLHPWHELRRSGGKEIGCDIMASPVRIAAERQQEGIMKLLWEFGATATLREAVAGLTLERAAWYDLRVTTKLLIRSGADVNAPGRESGKRPLELAKEKRHLEVIAMLEEAGAR